MKNLESRKGVSIFACMKPLKGKVFIVPETLNDLQEKSGSKIMIADHLGTIKTAAPVTGYIYAVSDNSKISVGQRVMFEQGVGLKIDTEGLCEHKELLVMREDDIQSFVDSDAVVRI